MPLFAVILNEFSSLVSRWLQRKERKCREYMIPTVPNSKAFGMTQLSDTNECPLSYSGRRAWSSEHKQGNGKTVKWSCAHCPLLISVLCVFPISPSPCAESLIFLHSNLGQKCKLYFTSHKYQVKPTKPRESTYCLKS